MKEIRTFETRITNSKDRNYLKTYVFKYRHWQNVLTILVINLFKSNNPDYRYFLDYEVVRACVSGTKGSKRKREIIRYVKEKYKDNRLYRILIETGKELKTHNLTEITKRLKKDFSNYFTLLKDYKENPNRYTGMPKLPKAKKLSKLTHYSIPLDGYVSITFKKKNLVGINLGRKMRYFYIGKTENIPIFKNNIRTASVKFQNNEIYLQFAYEKDIPKPDFKPKPQKYAGLDIGINNLISLFVDDKETPSLIVGGEGYKYYNHRFNKLISKLNEDISKEAVEFEKSKTGTEYPVRWSSKGYYLKRFKTYLIQKRNEYFKNNFHKLSKKIIEYLKEYNVTHLVISTSLSELKNNGKCKLRKEIKQNFIQIPFVQLLNYIEEKCRENGIDVIKVNESYTSKVSCITENICDIQASKDTNALKSKRVARGLFKDKTLDKVWNADLNGAVNHIRIVTNKSFEYLKNNLWKLSNPVKLKSAGELHSLLCNIRSSKSYERRTTARAYRYAVSF